MSRPKRTSSPSRPVSRRAPAEATLIALLCLTLGVLPAYAAPPVDAPVATVNGELVKVVADDFDLRRSEVHYYIEDRNGQRRYRLDLGGAHRSLGKPGRRVTVTGRLDGDRLSLDAGQVELLAAAGTDSNEILASGQVTGQQQTLVIVADFSDVAVDCSVSQVRDIIFSDPQGQTVDALYRESSQGAVSFAGTVVGPYRLPHASTGSCDTAGWADAAEARAAAAGVDLSRYPRKVYVLPRQNSCGASGYGSVGGEQTRAWIMRCELPGLYAHELGHNLGMNHASTLTSEYGDGSDPMGMEVLGLRQHNAPHQEQMGWRPGSQFRAVSSSGFYDVAPLQLTAAQASAAQALVIPKPDTGDQYFVSYRAPIGFDASLSSGLLSRLHVHRYARNGGRTIYVTGLLVGETFTDSANSISITHVSRSTSYSTVEVRMGSGNGQCTRSTPAVAVSPSSQSAPAGSARSYTVSVSNRDSAACPATSFAMSGSVPAGWSVAASPALLSLAPGAVASTMLTVTSASAATAGSYALSFSAADGTIAGHSASVAASYTVEATCTRRVPVLTLSPNQQSGSPGQSLRYTLTVWNQDSAACAGTAFNLTRALPGGWAGTLSTTSLTLAPGAGGSATLDVTSTTTTTSGTYTVTATASDSIGRVASGSGTYSVAGTQQDTVPPTAPSGLTASYNSKQGRVSLSWTASSDNIGVTNYRVWRDGVLLGESNGTWFVDGTVAMGPSYVYSVTARDAAGNQSAASNTVMVTTQRGGGGKRAKGT